LVLSLVIYLASLSEPHDRELAIIRVKLQPFILSLRDSILLALPESFVAIQCLELLAVHAPFGILPVQMVCPRSLSVARGQIGAAVQISASLKYSVMVRQMTQVSKMKGAPPHVTLDQGEKWLWYGLCAAEAALALEMETIRKPASLADAKEAMGDFFGNDYHDVWTVGLHAISPPELIGRLATCDRISRLSEVIDTCIRLRTCLDTAASDPSYDVIGALTDEIRYGTERLEAIDTRHDAILSLISPTSNGIESGWLAYRSIRRRYEACKVYVQALRYFIATMYLPGHPLAFANLPSELPPFQRAAYALNRAFTPSDIIPVIMATNNPATQATWVWGKHRGDVCESALLALTEFGWNLPGASRDNSSRDCLVIPLHDILCIAVDTAKALMEMRAGSIVMDNRAKSPHNAQTLDMSGWVYYVRQIAEMMGNIAGLSAPPTRASELNGSNASGQPEGLVESLASGCSNLLGSMVRLAENWRRDRNSEGLEVPQPSGSEPHPHTTPSSTGPTLNDAMNDYTPSTMSTNDASTGGVSQGHAHEEGGGAGYGPYMDTSDRWMASDHPVPPPHDPHRPPPGEPSEPPAGVHGYGSGPTPLDLLLSHMFNYSYQPASHSPGGPAGHHQPPPQHQQQQQQPQPPHLQQPHLPPPYPEHPGHPSHGVQSEPMKLGGSGQGHVHWPPAPGTNPPQAFYGGDPVG
jgi:hypothetical protein